MKKFLKKIKVWIWDDAAYPVHVIFPVSLLLFSLLGFLIILLIKFWNVIVGKLF